MTAQELNTYIDKVLGNSLRCLLPSYWWKRLLKLVVDYADEQTKAVSENVNKQISILGNDVEHLNNAFMKSALFRIKVTAIEGNDAIVVADGNEIIIPAGKSKNIPFTHEFKVGARYGGIYIAAVDATFSCTSFIEDMSKMFYSCNRLKVFDVSSFDTSNVKSMDFMFAGSSSLVELDLSNFDTTNVMSMSDMFSSCINIETLTLGVNFFKTNHVTSISFESLGSWSSESAIQSLVTNSYDRASNGLPTLNLFVSQNVYDYLTDDHKAILTQKGYTISASDYDEGVLG